MFQQFNEWFWKDSDWLPPGVKWEDVKNVPISELYISPFVAIAFLIIRYMFEKYIALDFCFYIGIIGNIKKEKNDGEDTEAPSGNQKDRLRVYLKSKLYKQTTQLQKATETCWRCFVYFLLFVYGSYVVLGSHWFWEESWMTGYITNQPMTTEMKWYIIIELSFYMSLTISQFTDTKRKDFYQQVIHHITTIVLISGCYIIAHYYHGSVIMLLHDASDHWLEAAKLAKYAKKQRLCDILFIIFAITFYIMRWFYFPFWVLHSYATDNPSLSGPSYFNYPHLFLYLCFVLIALHYYWGYLIAKMVYKFVATGQVEKDERSDDEDDKNAND